MIKRTMLTVGGDLAAAAKELGLTKTVLQKKLKG
jgi:DNA-binding protein Fis